MRSARAPGWMRPTGPAAARPGSTWILVVFVLLGVLLAPALASEVNGAIKQVPFWIDKLNAFTQQHFNTTVVSASSAPSSRSRSPRSSSRLCPPTTPGATRWWSRISPASRSRSRPDQRHSNRAQCPQKQCLQNRSRRRRSDGAGGPAETVDRRRRSACDRTSPERRHGVLTRSGRVPAPGSSRCPGGDVSIDQLEPGGWARQPTWIRGRRAGSGSALRSTSRVTGATSPSPKIR
jgi:hypothetical protein